MNKILEEAFEKYYHENINADRAIDYIEAKDTLRKIFSAGALLNQSIVRDNMISDVNYRPYCPNCSTRLRTYFNGNQMQCVECDWKSSFEKEFIEYYVFKHGLNPR